MAVLVSDSLPIRLTHLKMSMVSDPKEAVCGKKQRLLNANRPGLAALQPP